MSIPTPGSLTNLMTELMNLESTIPVDQQLSPELTLSVFMWRPLRAPDRFPAIWNWWTNTTTEQRDLTRFRDVFQVSAFIGIKHVDQAKDMRTVMTLADAFRDTVDPQLYRKPPLNRAVTWAKRTGGRLVSQDFAGVPILAIEFPMEFQCDRQLTLT